MTDNKLTDAEIVKALECCANGEVEECKNCPYVEGYPYCDGPMERDALDLINRQNAEIERLKEENENLRDSLAKKKFKDELFEMTLGEYKVEHQLGKTVFLTKEEAEEKLKELGE